MRSGVPDEILDAEIQRILDLGAELKCGCGEIAGEPAYAAVVETAGLEAAEASGVAAAIAGGLAAAQDADARMRGGAAVSPAHVVPTPAQRMHPEWYKEQPSFDGAGEMTAEAMVGEARRCMSCGMCMGCGNCWMYCTKGGFERIASSRRYRLNLERCNGCGKCADGCPSGYIDLK
jgi:Pyruvate/2-oxoacid:ferredoxin oxidoreductase delta subunit